METLDAVGLQGFRSALAIHLWQPAEDPDWRARLKRERDHDAATARLTGRLRRKLLSSPGAVADGHVAISVPCPFHPDTHPSAMVICGEMKLWCDECDASYKLEEWIDSPGGRAVVGDDLADEILAHLGAGPWRPTLI